MKQPYLTENKREKNAMKIAFLALIGLCILGLCFLASLYFGSRSISFEELIQGLSGMNTSLGTAVIEKRLVRTVFCILAGATLAISGTLMQGITRNPIADPGILGVNTGASLLVVIGIAFFNIHGISSYMLFALIGAFASAFFVYGLGTMGKGGFTPIKLALAGSALSIALNSLISAIMLPRAESLMDFRFWQVGSVGGATWQTILVIFPFLVVGSVIGIVYASQLNALALGDDVAVSLGVKVNRTRLIVSFAGVILCGSITALAGPIGYVGLIAPHVVRQFLGPDYRRIIPFSALAGAIILVCADVIGRLLGSPGELEVGIVTAMIGAPVLIIIILFTRKKAL